MRCGLRFLKTWGKFGVVLASAENTSVKRWESLGELPSGTAWTLVSLHITFEELRVVRFVHCGLIAYSKWVRFW